MIEKIAIHNKTRERLERMARNQGIIDLDAIELFVQKQYLDEKLERSKYLNEKSDGSIDSSNNIVSDQPDEFVESTLKVHAPQSSLSNNRDASLLKPLRTVLNYILLSYDFNRKSINLFYAISDTLGYSQDDAINLINEIKDRID